MKYFVLLICKIEMNSLKKQAFLYLDKQDLKY